MDFPDTARVASVQVGRIAPLGPESVPSAFVKLPVTGPVHAATLGLAGDEQADLTVHGGPDKAVYLYPSEHYPLWLRDVPRHAQTLMAGAFGENITTSGLEEATVAIGDVFRIGTAEVQVTQPRQPCFKLGLRFDDNSLGRIMTQTGRTGWYVRVLKPGTFQAGDEIGLLLRPNPTWTVTRFNGFILNRKHSRDVFPELAKMAGLADHWKQWAADAIINPRGG